MITPTIYLALVILSMLLFGWPAAIVSWVVVTSLWGATRRALRRRRAHRSGWASAHELADWERERTKSAEYLRISRGS